MPNGNRKRRWWIACRVIAILAVSLFVGCTAWAPGDRSAKKGKLLSLPALDTSDRGSIFQSSESREISRRLDNRFKE